MNRLAVDTSSAILLYKAGLFSVLLSTYTVVAAPAVCREMTQSGYPGFKDFSVYIKRRRIIETLPDYSAAGISDIFSSPEWDDVHDGEMETAALVLCGRAEAVMLDDGPGANFCKHMNVPFINALLFPKILYHARIISDNQSSMYLDTVMRHGRYSPDIVEYAQQCTLEQVRFFLPGLDTVGQSDGLLKAFKVQ